MLGWLARFILFLSGMLVGLFMAEEEPSFPIVKLVVAIFLIALVLAAGAFWHRSKKPDGSGDQA